MPPQPRPGTNLVVCRLEDPTRLRGVATRALYEYWQEKRGARPYPAWPDIHLVDLWRIASCIGVKDVIDGGAEFLNRYWGSEMTAMSGVEGSGKTTTEIYGDRREAAFVNYRETVETGEPMVAYRRLTFIDDREYVTYEVVHLPLGPEGGPVTQIISAFDFECDLRDILGH